MDEFKIIATSSDGMIRSWTRDTLGVAKIIADKTIQQGFKYAEVRSLHCGGVLYYVGSLDNKPIKT